MILPWQLVVNIVGLCLVVCATAPAFLSITSRLREKYPRAVNVLYEDKDGNATEDSQCGFSVKLQKILLSIAAIAGTCVTLATSIFATVNGHQTKDAHAVELWLQFALWTLITFQTAVIVAERNPVRRFHVALCTAISFLVLVTQLYCTNQYLIFKRRQTPKSALEGALALTSFVLAFLGFITCITIPRRPHVYHAGRVVDGESTVSALSRFTYTWPSQILAVSAAGKRLDIMDLPTLDAHHRAKDLHDAWVNMKRTGNIIKLVVFAHLPAFIRQYSLTVLQSLFLVAPQLAMYNLLKLLEARDAGASVNTEAFLWVIGLGLAMVIETFLDNWVWWISYGHLNIPVRVQLSALVFSKSMRRKDVKGVGGRKERAEPAEGAQVVVTDANGHTEEANAPGHDVEEDLQKTRQGTINLVGVDTKRVADYTTYGYLIFGALCRLAISFTFLGKIIGWQALLAGVAVQVLFLPVNIYFSKRYSDAQEKIMAVRDRKLAVLNEALNGIRQIKFSALERQWQKKIQDIRGQELDTQWQVFIADTFIIFCWLIGPVMLSAVSIGTYALIHKTLTASIAFTTIAILGQIEGTLAFIPELTTDLLDALVSIRRIGEYLDAPEKVQNTVPGDSVSFQDATISWPSDEEEKDNQAFALRDLKINFPNGELSVISGRTGSGKSLLLAAILGESEVLSGKVTVPQAPPLKERHDHKANKSNWIIPSALAFVSQQPWIENATFKDNVLFGLPFDQDRYRKTITACALDKDLTILEDGDQTEIGANGINLSGGQRWRVTLARAIYSRAGILVMDDIFSAVDAHVGKHIFEQALTGELCEGRTRILVTHHVSLCLPKTNYQVHLGEGRALHAGPVKELEQTGDMDEILDEEEDAITEDEEPSDLPNLQQTTSRASARRGSRLSRQSRSSTMDGAEHQENGSLGVEQRVRRLSELSRRSNRTIDNSRPVAQGKAQPKKFVEEEKRNTGRIEWSVYKAYMTASGGFWYWVVVLIAFGGYQGLLLGRSWWLTLWTQRYETKSAFLYQQQSLYRLSPLGRDTGLDDSNSDLKFYLGVYLGLAVAICIEGTLRYIWVFYGSLKASRRMFEELTHAVLRAPLRWLDVTPMGRVLNRFTADFNVIDSQMANSTAFMLFNVLMVVGIVVAGVVVSPIMIIFAIVLLAICVRYAQYYLAGARETKRLESVAKSPVFELFSAALSGVGTIRAFGKSETYIDNMFAKIDAHAQASWYMWLFNRWLTWRLGVIGAAFSVAMAALIVSLKSIDAPLGGFALGFTLQYTDSVVWMLRQYANVELGMNATERIVEYTEIPIEDEGGNDAPASWPSEGRLEVHDLVVGYAPDLPPVLNGLTFNVERNQRIGVVGRTGAGKSSLTLALFRFLEARRGTIHIDGLDISKIKLHDLRSRLAIIPQDPVLFSGTVRSNIDPFNDHSDQELRDALKRVHLISSSDDTTPDSTTPSNTNIFNNLTSPISEGGLNLSQGQRQLLCLARAIVARPKIMVLDEATSAVDKMTDELIQRSIREEFQGSTLIVIAHRLSTIADFDRILVMGEGRVLEYGPPRELLESGEVFKGMVEDSGEGEALREIIFGEN